MNILKRLADIEKRQKDIDRTNPPMTVYFTDGTTKIMPWMDAIMATLKDDESVLKVMSSDGTEDIFMHAILHPVHRDEYGNVVYEDGTKPEEE